jgi:hypothetical protein
MPGNRANTGGNRRKKNQPGTVGFLNSGGNLKYELTAEIFYTHEQSPPPKSPVLGICPPKSCSAIQQKTGHLDSPTDLEILLSGIFCTDRGCATIGINNNGSDDGTKKGDNP